MLSLLRVLGAFLLTLGVSEATAQEVRTITDEVSCDSCAIERYLLATIHDRSFPEGALITSGTPHVNSDGTFLVIAGPMMQKQLFLAESDGSIVRRIGSTGEGPGEYERVFHVHELPEAYLIFDVRLGRVTRLTKTTFEVLGTAPFPHFGGGVPPLVFEDGSYLRSGKSNTRGGAGHLFHLFDASGRAIRSFGGGDGALPPRSRPNPGYMALSRDGTFWVADLYQYRLERWDREGNFLAAYQRETDWFPHYPLDEAGRPQRGSRSLIWGLWEDENGLLWVHGHQPEGGPTSVIEVIDPTAGTLVASSRVEGPMAFSALGGFHQMVTKEDPQSLLVNVEVWGARFKTGPEHHAKRRNHE